MQVLLRSQWSCLYRRCFWESSPTRQHSLLGTRKDSGSREANENNLHYNLYCNFFPKSVGTAVQNQVEWNCGISHGMYRYLWKTLFFLFFLIFFFFTFFIPPNPRASTSASCLLFDSSSLLKNVLDNFQFILAGNEDLLPHLGYLLLGLFTNKHDKCFSLWSVLN